MIIMAKTEKSQEAISIEDLQVYLQYVVSGEVTNEEHAKQLKRLSKRTTTLSDVTLVFKGLQQQQNHIVGQLMDTIQVQGRVLMKLGATDEIFEEAEKEYDAALEKVSQEVRQKQEEAKKSAAGDQGKASLKLLN